MPKPSLDPFSNIP